jgi:NAD(P)H-hydrate epimerase
MACDTGKGWQYALPTKNTLTFGGRKFCHVLPHSADKCGRVQVLDIGISTENLKKAGATITEILPPVFEKRAKTSHKNDYGIGLSVCGSYGMPGAAIISARAALRAGIGVLKLACIEENYIPCAVSTPEAVLIPCKSWGKTYSLENAETLKEQLKTAHALLIGCGLGISEDAKGLVKELLLSTQVPTVLDADGINLIASDIELLKDVKAPLVLTPHAGEMARLLKTTSAQIEQNRIEIAADFSKKYGVYTVLKGANTIAATPRGDLSVNVMGNPGMATAGSGDMLAGIMLALLSQGMAVSDAVKGAVWLHSAAGDRAVNRLGERAMLPTDMIEELHHFL